MPLNGDRHETALTEMRGLWSVYCGCGWKFQDGTFSEATQQEHRHVDASLSSRKESE